MREQGSRVWGGSRNKSPEERSRREDTEESQALQEAPVEGIVGDKARVAGRPYGLTFCSSKELGPDPLVRGPLEDLVRECCDWLPLIFM